MQPGIRNAMRRERRCGRVKDAVEYSGLSRSGLYEKAPRYPGLFLKDGNTTIVDFDVLDRVIDDLPLAKIGTPTERTAAEAEATEQTTA